MPWQIRALRPDDIGRCCDIAVTAWEPVFASFRQLLGDELFGLGHADWRAEKARQVRWKCEQQPEEVIVTELEGQVVGFLTYHIDAERGMGEIGNNAVHPDFQGRGVGTAQCRCVVELFRERGLSHAMVWTGLDDSHAPARAMYEKVGFDRWLPGAQYWQKL